MNKILTAIFLPAALSGCATLDEFTDRYSRDRNTIFGYEAPNGRSSPFSPESRNFGRTRYNLTTRELFETRPRPRVTRDVRVVDFQSASQEIQEACTRTDHMPVPRQGGSDSGDRQAVIIYDINEYGKIMNTEVDNNLNRGGTSIAHAALDGIKRTRFAAPEFNGERLYCRNVTDKLYWFPKNIFTQVSMRVVGPRVRSLEW